MNGTREQKSAPERWHGTSGGYTNHRCRCDECRAAWRETCSRMRQKRLLKPVPEALHGTSYGYSGYGCRCEACTVASSLASRARLERSGKAPRSPYRRQRSQADREIAQAEVEAWREEKRRRRERRLASKTKRAYSKKPFDERYALDVDSGCWVWQENLHSGYGFYRGMNAHRWSYIEAGNEVPVGYHVDHLCRNRACVNPEHLEAVTPLENFTRGAAKGAVALREGVCSNGHPFAGDNVRVRRHGSQSRECVQCNRDRCRRYRENSKARLAG